MSLAPDSAEWTTLDRAGRLARVAHAIRQMLPTLLSASPRSSPGSWSSASAMSRPTSSQRPRRSAWALVAHAQDLAVATVATAREVFVGFVLSLLVGVALALLIIRFRRLGRALYPLIVFFQTVPKVALAPIFILWFGYDLAPKALLILVIAFFPITLNMLAGLRSVRGRPCRATWSRSGQARTRSCSACVSRTPCRSSWRASRSRSRCASSARSLASSPAPPPVLGYVIQFASTQLETPVVFAALVVVSLLGSGFYYVSELLERLIVPWAPQLHDGGRS